MNLVSEFHADTMAIKVGESRIDAAVAVQFKDAFRAAVQKAPSRVVLDLSQVEFLDSSGLGAIVAAMKILAPDRRLELAGMTDTVQKVFRLTRMDTVFTMHDTLEAALSASAESR